MTDGVRRIILGPGSVTLRRRLGPTAWVVLEELLARSTGTAESCWSSVSVRSLASELGLAKDTVGRALSRVRCAGLVSACQTCSTSGAFAAGSYLLVVPESVAIDDDSAVSAPTSLQPTDNVEAVPHLPKRLAARADLARRAHIDGRLGVEMRCGQSETSRPSRRARPCRAAHRREVGGHSARGRYQIVR